MANIKTNERELVSKISEWINEIIKRGNYPFTSTSVETGVKVKDSTKFGDLIIWKNRETSDAYSYIELKPPFGNTENLETFKQKAIELKVKYAFTWDFQNLRAFEINKNKIVLKGTDSESILIRIEDWLRGDYKAKIKAYLNRILDEIVNLNETGKLRKFTPDKIYFINCVRNYVQILVPKYEKFLREVARKTNKKLLIAEYATKQGIAYPSDAEYYKLIANQSVYALNTKIIFYLTIRRYFKDLPDVYLNEDENIENLFKLAFTKAREKDWQAVFEEGPIELLGIPESIFEDLRALLTELKIYHFGELAEDVVGELFEEIIDPNERHRLGQFFTNEDLVDLILGFAVQNKEGIYADPTCGSGTFLIRLYDRLKYLSANKFTHNNILNKIWGFDIGKFPAELSTINLFRQNVANYENFPKVICTDIFDVYKGKTFEFPPPNASKHFNKVNIPLPEFNGLVGNFPFIRQELIEKKDKGYKTWLTKVLAEEYFLTYPKLFNTKNLNTSHIERLKILKKDSLKKEIHNYVENKFIELRLSGQADIYTYIFIHTATLLSQKGTIAIITSNSWLDVSYGSVLKEFFLDNFKVKTIIATWAEPWFEDAAVNTVVTVLEKGNGKNHFVKFVKLKKKFEDLIPQRDLKLQSIERWRRIDSIVNTIETAEFHPKKKDITSIISSVDTDEMRIRLIKQSELKKEIINKKEFAKWGKYLRAPNVYFEILEKAKDKLVPLKEIANVRRGYTTGINEFFYLEKIKDSKPKNKHCLYIKNARGWQGEIEEEYLRPVIKSPKEAKSIIIDATKLRYKIFICNKSKNDLKKSGHIGALKYIEWGEKQKTKQGVKWTEVPSVKGRSFWWGIIEKEPGPILMQMINNNRFLIFINTDKTQVDHNLFEFLVEDKRKLQNLKYFLNSSLFALIKETNSRVNLGDGATKTEGVDWSNLMLAPKDLLNINKIENNFFNRTIFPIDKEIKQKDRQKLDATVLEALGLDPKEYLPRIYKGLTEIVKERLELPKMRKKLKTKNVKVAYNQIKEVVVKDVIPNGVKKFPDAFYVEGNYSDLDFDVFSTNGEELKTESFFNKFELKDETGKTIIETDSEIKAEFIEIMSRKNSYQMKIPKDEKVITKLLNRYDSYIKNLRKDLEQNAHQKLHDWNLAEKMAEEILSEWV